MKTHESQSDLLTGAVPATAQEKWNARVPDAFDRLGHEVFGVPTTHRWLQVETLGDGKSPRALTSFRCLMAEAPADVFKSGPREGEINWRKRDKSKDREFVATFTQLDAITARDGKQ